MMEQLFSPNGFDDPGSGPLYLQLHRLIAEAIASGRLKPGDSLPSERELAAMTGGAAGRRSQAAPASAIRATAARAAAHPA